MSSPTTSNTSSSSSSSWWGSGEGCSGEFEVARVLATLGTTAVTVGSETHHHNNDDDDNNNNNNRNKWGSKGKRSSHHHHHHHNLNNDNSSNSNNKRGKTSESELHPPGSNSLPLPFDLNLDQAAIFESDNGCEEVDVKAEVICESAELETVGNKLHTNNAGRSRQNLTEEEKEARRIRRILANRESARQTIRRRQALYEELTRKAADLASENENLKRHKDLAIKEFRSLQSTNQNLKEQISETLGFNLGGNRPGEATKTSDSNTSSNLLQSNWPLLVCNPMSTNSFFWPACGTDQKNPASLNTENMPWCILPCPWLLPVHLRNKDEIETLADSHKHVLSPTSILTQNSKTDTQTPKQEKAGNVFFKSSSGFSTHPKTEVQSASDGSNSNKKVDASAGAEARKKRKELMKLKSLHCRPTRGYG